MQCVWKMCLGICLGEALSVKTLLEQNLVLASCSQGGLNERLEENPTEQRWRNESGLQALLGVGSLLWGKFPYPSVSPWPFQLCSVCNLLISHVTLQAFQATMDRNMFVCLLTHSLSEKYDWLSQITQITGQPPANGSIPFQSTVYPRSNQLQLVQWESFGRLELPLSGQWAEQSFQKRVAIANTVWELTAILLAGFPWSPNNTDLRSGGPVSSLPKCGWCQGNCWGKKALSVVPWGAVGRMGRIGLDFSTQREEHVWLGVEWEEARLAGTEGLSLLRGCDFSGRWRETGRGDTLGSGKWLAPQREDFLIPLAQSPRDLVFISLLAKEVALVQGALNEGRSCVTFLQGTESSGDRDQSSQWATMSFLNLANPRSDRRSSPSPYGGMVWSPCLQLNMKAAQLLKLKIL